MKLFWTLLLLIGASSCVLLFGIYFWKYIENTEELHVAIAWLALALGILNSHTKD